MNVWKHSVSSQMKFGGSPEDYQPIHSFLDSSKLFLFHLKHRALLHNLYGIELCEELFGPWVKNSAGSTVAVRDIAAQHLREDLSGRVPTLNDWFADCDDQISPLICVPKGLNAELKSFVMRPWLRSGLRSSLIVTCSNFGVMLAERCLGILQALELASRMSGVQNVAAILEKFRFTQRWQYSPDRESIQRINRHEEESLERVAGSEGPIEDGVVIRQEDHV